MARTFRGATLFDKRSTLDPKLAVYPTIKAHLDAMKPGKKGLSHFGFPVSYMLDGGPEYAELIELAFKRGLLVVLQNNWIPHHPFERQQPHVFVARPEELWRIPAWLALWETAFVDQAWTNAAEAQSSLLLGYTERQRGMWIAHFKQRRAAWTGITVYTILTVEQKRRVLELGQRCLGSPEELVNTTLFFPRMGRNLRPDARRRVPRGMTLARMALPSRTFRNVFGEPRPWRKRPFVEAVLTRRSAAELNRGLGSTVQLLGARGWR